MRLCFIGGGTMAEAMLAAVLKKKVATPGDIWVCEPSLPRCQNLHRTYKVSTRQEYAEAITGRDIIVLAIKPQDLPSALTQLWGKLSPGQLALSVVAGASLATVTGGLGHQAVVRVMPNINARVGGAVSVWTATTAVPPEQREMTKTLLEALGKQVYTPEEKHLDMATALSGSGPAYVLLFIEALTDAGVHIGLPREMAAELALGTVAGSAKLAQETGEHPALLRSLVVSPGGTTAEALLRLEEGGFRGLVVGAVVAAYRRAQGIGKGG